MYRSCVSKRICGCNQNSNQELENDTYVNIPNNMCMVNSCECGFDEENNMFPANPMFAQSYVPIQTMNKTFTPEVGLAMGTIFPELVSPYMPGQSMEEIEFIRNSNKIGKGCNQNGR